MEVDEVPHLHDVGGEGVDGPERRDEKQDQRSEIDRDGEEKTDGEPAGLRRFEPARKSCEADDQGDEKREERD